MDNKMRCVALQKLNIKSTVSKKNVLKPFSIKFYLMIVYLYMYS